MQQVISKFKYPNWVNEIAHNVGMHRSENNRKLDERKPEYVRPDEYSINGAKGELLYNIYLWLNNIDHKANVLYGDGPVPEYDVIVQGVYYVDVKTIGIDKKNFSVNYDAHHKTIKYITHYVFIKLHPNNECDIYHCKWWDIESWEVGTKTRPNGTTSKFYFKPI